MFACVFYKHRLVRDGLQQYSLHPCILPACFLNSLQKLLQTEIQKNQKSHHPIVSGWTLTLKLLKTDSDIVVVSQTAQNVANPCHTDHIFSVFPDHSVLRLLRCSAETFFLHPCRWDSDRGEIFLLTSGRHF